MGIKITSFTPKKNTGIHIASKRKTILFILLSLLLPVIAFATKDENPDEEISVTIEIKDVGSIEVPAVYHNKELYLSISGVFNFIKVKNTPSPAFDSISGFFLNEKDVFLIDGSNDLITYRNKTYKLGSSDLIQSSTNLYMNLKDFKTVFGLDGAFNFRRLWVIITSNEELPSVREARQDLMRKNMSGLNGDQKADTTIPRSNPLFHLGMADWAISSTQQSQAPDNTRLNLGLGGVLLGGETNVALNYYTNQPFSELQQYYQWRYVNNDNSALRQVAAGKIFVQSIASLYAPVVGLQFSNAPTTNRRSYGSYLISDRAEPGWIVELYINDVLIDYKKTDASGFYTFNVPIIYGNTIVKLRFYGPYGEEHTTQKYISIPFNFIPIHEFEYTASGGIVEDGLNSRYAHVTMNYGLSSHLTIGGGMEYLSSVTSGAFMPFLISSLRLAKRLMLSGEYTYGVRAVGILSYRLPSNLQIDFNYTKYTEGQTAIYYNYLEERKAVISMPIHGTDFSLFSRLTIDQITVPLSKYTNTELDFTGSIGKVGLNLSTYASFAGAYLPYLYSLASVSFMLPKKINFTAQVEYDYKAEKPAFMKYTFERYLFGKGYLNISYQEFFTGNTEYFTGNYYNILVGMRYDFSFARVYFSELAGNNNTYSRVESASGSLIYDAKTNYFNANNRTNVGKGGIVLVPYLDVNCNGKRDPGEPLAQGLRIRINGGRIVYEKDTTIRVFDLEPYNNYYVELNSNSFDNIAWQLKVHSLKVAVSANNFTLVEVPIEVVGEVSGTVLIKNNADKKGKGQRQMIVGIYNTDGQMVARTVSESDGYFDYIGLAPGSYTVRIDPAQLQKLHFTAAPIPFRVRILGTNDGDLVTGLEVIMKPVE